VSAIGADPLQYQWKKDGAVVSDPESTGTTTQILTIHTFSQNHQGSYTCIVSNGLQSVESKAAHLALGISINLIFQTLLVLYNKYCTLFNSYTFKLYPLTRCFFVQLHNSLHLHNSNQSVYSTNYSHLLLASNHNLVT
jgi:hypothetical protein